MSAILLCHYCSRKFKRTDLTRDHIVPKSLGGRDTPANYVLACEQCNTKKADSWPTCGCFRCQRAIKFHGGEPQLTPRARMRELRQNRRRVAS